MDISIIISNYAPKGKLVAAIDHALAQDAAAGDYEVIFPLHGAITEADLEQLRGRAARTGQLRLLTGDGRNRAGALNDAVRSAASERLVFLESHVLAPPDLAAHYRRILLSPEVAAVQGAFAAVANTNWVSEVESSLRALSGARRRARGLPTDEFHLHSAGFQRGALLAAGGFDEHLPGVAEVPLLQRIQDSGGTIAWLRTPAVHHINHSDFRGIVRALRGRGREVGLLWRLDPGVASRTFPTVALERHGALVRRAHGPLWVAGAANLSLAFVILAISRAFLPRWFTLAAAALVTASAIRAGVLEGYCH